MISRVCYCFRLSRVSYSLYCNKLSVHNMRDTDSNKSSDFLLNPVCIMLIYYYCFAL